MPVEPLLRIVVSRLLGHFATDGTLLEVFFVLVSSS